MQKHTAVALAQTSLIVVILLWFTAVMVDCDSILSRDCDKEIWKSWLALWRLEWIKGYKELIAGLVAAGAAALVLVSTRLQLSAAEERHSAEQRASNVAIFTVLAHKFGTAHAAITSVSASPAEERIFDDLKYSDAFIAQFGTYYGLAEITRINTTRALAATVRAAARGHIYRRFSDLSETTKTNAAMARACMEIFDDLAKAVNGGSNIGTKPLASKRLRETLDIARMIPEQLGRAHAYLSWPPITREVEGADE